MDFIIEVYTWTKVDKVKVLELEVIDLGFWWATLKYAGMLDC